VQTQDNDVYSPETLAVLWQVLEETFRIATGNGPVRSGWQDHVRTRLAEVIMNGAANGVRDPAALRRMALTSVAMGYLDSSAARYEGDFVARSGAPGRVQRRL
jgi:hypothetical protein